MFLVKRNQIWSPRNLELILKGHWGTIWANFLKVRPPESHRPGPKASGKLCEPTPWLDLPEPQSSRLQNGNNLKFITALVWRVCESVHQKACHSWPMVITKKEFWDPCESQEEVADYSALEHSYICFSLPIFRGNKVISLSVLDVKTQYILSGHPRLFDVGWLCVLFWRMACL